MIGEGAWPRGTLDSPLRLWAPTWSTSASRAISAVAELLVWLCGMSSLLHVIIYYTITPYKAHIIPICENFISCQLSIEFTYLFHALLFWLQSPQTDNIVFTLLCLRQRIPSVPEAYSFRVCPSVSESVRHENLVNTISRKQMKGISPNFGHICSWVHRCAGQIWGLRPTS